MYVICIDPENVEINSKNCMTFQKKSMIPQYIEHMTKNFPGKSVFLYKLEKKVIPKIEVTLASYIVKENGEVIPE